MDSKTKIRNLAEASVQLNVKYPNSQNSFSFFSIIIRVKPKTGKNNGP